MPESGAGEDAGNRITTHFKNGKSTLFFWKSLAVILISDKKTEFSCGFFLTDFFRQRFLLTSSGTSKKQPDGQDFRLTPSRIYPFIRAILINQATRLELAGDRLFVYVTGENLRILKWLTSELLGKKVLICTSVMLGFTPLRHPGFHS
ncbi:MAG: hypothetical protein P0Y53_15690 [Candidatus Pseudobacter hemicellulosilyticus]|uniref:Uncharacterized protein n=1 Tax=Candidatus Pseudobacter hemicellulosilyticus TaxID=3121375 RepID=A0AAJ5WNG7_9BACT|nr:MAG: hypothetical protein P0Y53_15690 [Pseudobacter sp.]